MKGSRRGGFGSPGDPGGLRDHGGTPVTVTSHEPSASPPAPGRGPRTGPPYGGAPGYAAVGASGSGHPRA
ncbi:hypothetical protein ACFVZQ_36850, partial [Streptomyces sp. NPDC059538]